MKKRLSSLFLGIHLLSSHSICQSAINYETYLESWDGSYNNPPTWQKVLEGFGNGASNSYVGVTLNIAFASYTCPAASSGSITATGLSFSSLSNITTIVDYVHSHGGKVKLAYGGASYAYPCAPNYFISQTTGWPGNAQTLANGIISTIQTYGFDGVDFDIEDPNLSNDPTVQQTFANELITFLGYVRAGLPNSIISLTIPAQGWNTYWYYLATQAANTPCLVNCINFMEYDIWVNGSLSQGYPEQIAADITTYTSATTTSPAPNYSPGWGIPIQMIQIGLMPGNDDISDNLTVNGASSLASLAQDSGAFGVMTWDLDRDAGYGDPKMTPSVTYPSYSYSIAIQEALANPQPISNFHFTPNLVSRSRSVSVQTPFIPQSPPQHGAPSN